MDEPKGVEVDQRFRRPKKRRGDKMEAFSNVGYNYNPNNYGSAQARSQMANVNLTALGVLFETVRERDRRWRRGPSLCLSPVQGWRERRESVRRGGSVRIVDSERTQTEPTGLEMMVAVRRAGRVLACCEMWSCEARVGGVGCVG